MLDSIFITSKDQEEETRRKQEAELNVLKYEYAELKRYFAAIPTQRFSREELMFLFEFPQIKGRGDTHLNADLRFYTGDRLHKMRELRDRVQKAPRVSKTR